MIEFFLGVRLEGNLRGGFFLWLVGKPLHVDVDIFQSFFKGSLRAAIREEYFPLIEGDLIYPVTERLLIGFLRRFLLRSLFGFAFRNQRSQVQCSVAVAGYV